MPLTPAMKQYMYFKDKYPDCLLLFRMGDFYETFYEDAKKAAEVLEITLTARGKGEGRAPLAGIPYHALEPYLAKLVKNNIKVAICEQVEDPKLAKGIVKRDVTRIVTPGTLIDQTMLDEKSNNYIASLNQKDNKIAFTFSDMSTGEFFTFSTKEEDLNTQLAQFQPKEIILPLSLTVNRDVIEIIKKHDVYYTAYDDRHFKTDNAQKKLLTHFKIFNLEGFGIKENLEISTSGALLSYLQETQFNELNHLKNLKKLHLQEHMVLDSTTLRNLEIIRNIKDNTSRGTLLSVLDKTSTSLGTRMLKKWLQQPLLNKTKIEERLNSVEVFTLDPVLKDEIINILKQINDLERLISRINYGNANARDLLSLNLSLQQLPYLKEKTPKSTDLLSKIAEIDTLDNLKKLLSETIVENPPMTIREGGMIKPEYNEKLKELHDIRSNSKQIILEIEQKEKNRTNIKHLRIKFNKVFGYFIEVSKGNLHLVPEDYIRKQTLVNAERYVTPDLKEIEEKILNSQEKIHALESDIFQSIIQETQKYTQKIQDIANKIATIDCLISFATIASNNNYTKPSITEEPLLELKDCRHPVVEQMVDNFIPNNIHLNKNEVMVITGPNMAGKCVTGESLIYTEMGMVEFKKIVPPGIKANEFKAFNKTIVGKNGKEKTSHIYYNGKKETIKIQTKFGYEIEGTENHPILVRDNKGQEVWKKLGKIKKDDFIIINRKINLWGSKTRFPTNLIKEVKNYNYNNKIKKYPLPKKLDLDISYLIGLLIGDGTLTYKNGLALSNNDPEIVRDFKKIIWEKFRAKVSKKPNKNDFVISSKRIRLFFEKIGLDYLRSTNKEIPYCILHSPKKYVKSFLQGLFDTDGTLDNRYGSPSLSTSSKKLARQVHCILLNFGIISSLKIKKTPREINYIIGIYGENAIKFHNRIGVKVSRKLIRKKLISNTRMPNYGIPHLEGILKSIQKRIMEKKDKNIALKKRKDINSIFYTYLPNKRNISYNKLKELIKYCLENEVGCQELTLIKNNNYHYDKIISITKSTLKKDVFDFTVPQSHSFTANGLINHNSTVMRQVALNVLMAQIGSFIPSEQATTPLTDRIFTRVGAHDDLTMGQSTFMLEMSETANILNNATDKSLIILDEIGRGTSTFDGVAIAWSVAEFIHNNIKAKTLFATHYHILNKLTNELEYIKNYNIAVKEEDNEIIFLRKLITGGTDKSYGVHVAKLAGLPEKVIERAKEVQKEIESEDQIKERIRTKKIEDSQERLL